MSAHRFTYLIRLVHVLVIVAICVVLAVGVSAAGRGDRSSDRGSGKNDSAKREAEVRREVEVRHAVEGRNGGGNRSGWSAARPDAPRAADTRQQSGFRGYNPGNRDRWNSNSSQSRDNRATGTNRPGDSNRSFQRPDRNSWQQGDRRNNRDTQGYRPSVGPRPTIDSRTNRPNRPHVYTSFRDLGRDNYRPRGYSPPTFRGGFYYYPSRPSYRPMHYGYWAFNYDPGFCRPSIYFYYGYFPYVQVARLYIAPYVSVSYYSRPVVIDDGYYLARRDTVGLDNALSDIRNAWLGGRFDLIKDHVSTGEKIAVLLDGKYDYSVDADDYIKMTSDAVDQIQTISFTWETTRQRTDGDYTAFGKHIYRDSSGTTKTVYVSYTLSRIGGDYIIVEVGSSASPLI